MMQCNTEVLGKTCIDGGKCHHACKERCFRRECCSPLSGYAGPWAYPDASRRLIEWRITVMRKVSPNNAVMPEGIVEDLTVYAETMPLALEIACRKVPAASILSCHAGLMGGPRTFWKQPGPLDRTQKPSFPFAREE